MGICTKRYFLLSICFLQLISTVERQVFDFLGYMWIPILVNFFEIVFVIFGFFGTFQYRPKYVISYSVWNFVLLAWNIFLICLYLDIGILNHEESKVLKLDPDSSSWWMTNGPGCQPMYDTNTSVPMLANVTGCLMNYVHVEVFHASFQCLLALLGFLTGLCLSKTFLEEDDSFEFLDGNSKNPQQLALQPLYVSNASIPLTAPSFPSCRSSIQSIGHGKATVPDQRTRASRASDSIYLNKPQSATSDHNDDSYADTSVDSRLPLYSYGHSPEMRRASRARFKSKPNIHVDQIRKFNHESDAQCTKSYDRLVQRDYNGRKNEIQIKNSRPKSLYTNAFLD